MRIALCGSTRFKLEYEYWNALLTACSHTCYSVAMWSHGIKVDPSPELKLLLDAVHMSKIESSEGVFIIDTWLDTVDYVRPGAGTFPESYMGESTKREHFYAMARGKKVFFSSSDGHMFKNQCQFLSEIGNMFRDRLHEQRQVLANTSKS